MLVWFEFHIMPVGGKKSLEDIQQWEVRDILPMASRLRRRGILTRVLIRTWEKDNGNRRHFLAEWLRKQVYDKENPVEVLSDISWSIPNLTCHWRDMVKCDHTTYRRIKCRRLHLGFPTLYEDSDRYTYHVMKNAEALAEFFARLDGKRRSSPLSLLIDKFWP